MEGIGQTIQVEQVSYDSGHWNGVGFLVPIFLLAYCLL